MLHPGVGGGDEVARKQRAAGHGKRGEPMQPGGYPAASEEQNPEKAGFQKEGERPFEREREAEDATGKGGELAPVGAELEFQRDAGNHADGKGKRENAGPELGRGPVA